MTSRSAVIGGKLEPKEEDFVPAGARAAGQLNAAGLTHACSER